MGRENLGLLGGDERPAVIDPKEFGVLKGIHQALGVLVRHLLVFTGLHDEYIDCKGALLFHPIEQQRSRWNTAQILAEIAANPGITAQELDSVQKLILGYAPRRKRTDTPQRRSDCLPSCAVTATRFWCRSVPRACDRRHCVQCQNHPIPRDKASATRSRAARTQ